MVLVGDGVQADWGCQICPIVVFRDRLYAFFEFSIKHFFLEKKWSSKAESYLLGDSSCLIVSLA